VAVTVPGKIIKSLDFKSVKTGSITDKSVVVTPTIRNTGNVSLDTKLKTELVPVLGTKVTEDNGSYPILPRSSASWNLEVKRPFWGGLYKARVSATYNADPAAGIGDKNDDPKTITRTSSLVFIAPATGALVIELLVLLLIIVAAGWLLRGRMHHRHVRRHWQSYSVKDGDTINSIANRFGVSWKRLAKANKLRAPYTLETGRRLRVPPSTKTGE
jgi:hypothetical protein